MFLFIIDRYAWPPVKFLNAQGGSMAERKYKRKYLMAEVSVKRRKGGPAMNALALNISPEGIGIYTMKPLKPKESVTVKITVVINGTLIVCEETAGAVRWRQQFAKNYAAGIKFEKKITRSAYPILYKCIVSAG